MTLVALNHFTDDKRLFACIIQRLNGRVRRLPLETAMHMPTPMLNVLNMSRSGMLPVFAMRSEDRQHRTAERPP